MMKYSFKLPFGYIFDESGQILLLKRIDRKSWEPVKGGMEEGEEPNDTVFREMLEETGFGKDDILEIYYDGERIIENNHIYNKKIPKKVFFVFYIKVKGINPAVKVNNIESGGLDHNGYGRFEMSELENIYIEYLQVLEEIKKGKRYFGF